LPPGVKTPGGNRVVRLGPIRKFSPLCDLAEWATIRLLERP